LWFSLKKTYASRFRFQSLSLSLSLSTT
jgi:hypothetical protein